MRMIDDKVEKPFVYVIVEYVLECCHVGMYEFDDWFANKIYGPYKASEVNDALLNLEKKSNTRKSYSINKLHKGVNDD